MAPSLSPALAAALDVRHATRDSSYGLLNVLAKTDLSVAAAVAPVATQSSRTSGIAIALGVLLAVVGASTIAATWCIAAQRKRLIDLSTILKLNRDNSGRSHVDCDTQHAQVTTVETTTDATHSVDSADKLPGTVPVATSTPHCVLPPPGLRRKHTRMVAKQRLRIFIPAGVAVPDVELVHSAAPCATPTALTSGVSVSRTLVSRRSIARTPRSALSSGFSAVSSAVIGVVQRREKIEPTMSRGWAPATMVRLPINPRNITRTVGMNGTSNSRKMGGKPVQRVLDPSGIAALDSGRCTPVMQMLSNI